MTIYFIQFNSTTHITIIRKSDMAEEYSFIHDDLKIYVAIHINAINAPIKQQIEITQCGFDSASHNYCIFTTNMLLKHRFMLHTTNDGYTHGMGSISLLRFTRETCSYKLYLQAHIGSK